MVTIERQFNADRNQFWQTMWIWLTKPHLVNKRLFAQNTLHVLRSSTVSVESMKSYILETSHNNISENNLVDFLIQEGHSITSLDDSQNFSENHRIYVLIRTLIFKNDKHENVLEVIFLDYSTNEVTSLTIHKCLEECTMRSFLQYFTIHYTDNNVIISLENESTEFSKWIELCFLPKLQKWAEHAESNPTYEDESKGSLKHIDIAKYNELYSFWKDKYGPTLIKNWSECTDPQKFVYEDIAIAAYLHLLWESKSIKFVDLGCGNGLLVYILSQEGHIGHGIDIRSRKIWSTYPQTTVLKVGTIAPPDENCHFPEVDWIIGNHSDELTPWIPIFAGRSSPSCKFFVLPCCAYELNGQKFQRRKTTVSTYSNYIEYVEELCRRIGFDTAVDRLRIPSTKRICIIGRERVVSAQDMLNNIAESLSKSGVKNCKIRDAVEKVRNCTKVDRTVTTEICDTISTELIRRQLSIAVVDDNTRDNRWGDDGICLNFEEALAALQNKKCDLKKLKNECGGLKTVLKNNHSIFQIQRGRIQFRKPNKRDRKNIKMWKNKLCWFFHNHPFKCPLPENECSFIH